MSLSASCRARQKKSGIWLSLCHRTLSRSFPRLRMSFSYAMRTLPQAYLRFDRLMMQRTSPLQPWQERMPLCPGISGTSCDSTRCARTIRSTFRTVMACSRSSHRGGCSLTSGPMKKTFDALANKWAIQERIAEEITHLSPEEEIEYFRRESERGALGQWWRSMKMPARRAS
jgi:hypothetical protein